MRHEFYYEFVDTQNSVDGLLVWISILKSFVIDKEVKKFEFRCSTCYQRVSYRNHYYMVFLVFHSRFARNDDYYLIIVITSNSRKRRTFMIPMKSILGRVLPACLIIFFRHHYWHFLSLFSTEMTFNLFASAIMFLTMIQIEKNVLRSKGSGSRELHDVVVFPSIWWTLVYASFEAWVSELRKPKCGERKK